MTFERNPPIPQDRGDADPVHPSDSKGSAERRFAALTAGLLARKGEAEPAMDGFSHARIEPGAARQMEPGERHDIERQAAGEGRPAQIEPINDASDVREEWRRVRPAKPAEAPKQAPNEAPIPPREDAPRMPAKNPAPAETGDFADNCPRQKIAASPKRAAVTFRMSVHDFLRLKLAAAELEVPSQEIILASIETYLDDKGVERLDECACLARAAKACGDAEIE